MLVLGTIYDFESNFTLVRAQLAGSLIIIIKLVAIFLSFDANDEYLTDLRFQIYKKNTFNFFYVTRLNRGHQFLIFIFKT